MRIPYCCGFPMDVRVALGRFLELECGWCGAVSYLKAHEAVV